MMKRTLFLLFLLLAVGSDILSLPVPAYAQRTWPNDQGGRPAPPCTIYDSATNVVSFCTSTTPLPVSNTNASTGGGNPTGSENDPVGWGRSIFESTQAFDSRTGAGGTSFRWDDQNTLIVLRRTAATTIQRWVSNDRGVTYRLVASFAGGFANMGTMQGSIVQTQVGRYALNLGGGGVGAASHAFTTNLLTITPATGSAVVPTGGNSFGGGAISLSPTTANRLISFRVNTTASTCIGVLSTDGGATYTATTSEQTCAGSNGGSIMYVGGTTWLWVIPGSGAAFRSTDDGATYSAVTSPGANVTAQICIAPTNAPSGGNGYCLAIIGGAGAQSIVRSTDAGTTWTTVTSLVGLVNLGLSFSDYGSGILSFITDSNAGTISLFRSNDAGLTWEPSATVTYTGGSTPTGYFQGTPQNNRTGGSPTNGAGSAVWIPDGVGATQNPMYGTALPPGSTLITGTGGIPWTIDRSGTALVATRQTLTLANSQTTGAGATAVTIDLAATTGERWVVRSVEARCGTAADTSSVNVQTPVGTTIWSSHPTAVVSTTNFVREWATGLTGATSAAMRIVLAACTAGAGTLIVNADRAPAP